MRPLGPGAEVGGAEVIAHLARSNVLDVYDAWDPERGCRVAVKTLRPDRRRDRRARAALLREGRLLARLDHPHLVRAYAVRGGERPAVVLQTLRGSTLAALLEGGRLGVAEACHLGLQLGSALRHLHGRGLVHLDVKPSNVIAHAGTATLIDLSIARRPGRVKAGLGTWCSLAPEQARGGYAGPPADVWGLAALLHGALTGAAPFGDDDTTASAADGADPAGLGAFPCLAHGAPPIRSIRPRVPRALAATLDAGLEPDAAARPGLAALLDVLDEHAGRPHGPGRWTRSTG
jgi:serine/threonine protein kinase